MSKIGLYGAGFGLLVSLFAFSAGCGGGETDDADQSSQDMTAAEMNKKQGGAQDTPATGVAAHLLPEQHLEKVFEAPSTETVKELGVVKWDVYAGNMRKAGEVAFQFQGTVFYGSDANGDVKYVGAVDIQTGKAALSIVDKGGSVIGVPAAGDIEKLKSDFRMLRDKAEADRAASHSKLACGLTVAGFALGAAALFVGAWLVVPLAAGGLVLTVGASEVVATVVVGATEAAGLVSAATLVPKGLELITQACGSDATISAPRN